MIEIKSWSVSRGLLSVASRDTNGRSLACNESDDKLEVLLCVRVQRND